MSAQVSENAEKITSRRPPVECARRREGVRNLPAVRIDREALARIAATRRLTIAGLEREALANYH